MSKKNKCIYLDVLHTQLKMVILFMFIVIVIISVFKYVLGEDLEAKETGEKVSAKVIRIDEQNNPTNNPYKEDRNIYSITIEYYYNDEMYTYTSKTIPGKNVVRNDIIDIYIMNKNPNDVYVKPYKSNITPYFIIIFLTIMAIASIYSLISTISQIHLYKKALDKFRSITGKYVDVEVKTMIGNSQYYIICESDQINGTTMTFKSHMYNEKFLKSEIEKKGFKEFTIKYNPENIKQYIIDTNKIDRIMYR